MPPPTPSPTPTPAAPTTTIIVTLTPPPAPATQTVVVELPPEIVKQLAPAEDGLSQASATIIAALIAVAAALIAVAGVLYQVRATAREQQKNRAAENRRQRRTESSQLLADAAAAATGIDDSFYRSTTHPDDQENGDVFVERHREATLLYNRMKLVGLSNSAAALEVFLDTALDKFGSDQYAEFSALHAKLIDTFSAELAEQSNEPEGDARKRIEEPEATI